MASPALDLQDIAQPQESPPDSACKEAQKWIEQVTGRSFGDKDFRTGLENGILLCELLNAIKPGLVKKINRLPTPIAGLDNLTLFLRGCKELGLKESQLFDPGDLQDTSNRTTLRTSDCSRKLRNVLVTVYWLGKVANSCSSYDGKNLDLKEFEELLAQMRKENEEIESPKRSIRDSGYIDCWDSERSDSLSPPRHGRDDSFDSLDSFGSRSQQTPSPDVVLRGSSDGRGSDSESDVPHRRIPDVRKDDMSARRVSFGENKAFVPFNQYLPNKGNHTAYIPAPLRKKKAEREDYRKSWSTATSPLGGERPFRSVSMCDMRYEEEAILLPHSRLHQEHLQNVNDMLKEEDDTWQDDLARWKTRRRSASQDLLKKEEERKKMERLLSGDYDLSERRKSIKTYKEIVEEKERREKQLHEAYKNAKSKAEAEKILQKYIERFTISEAVLERLVMPKILERSHSVEPSLLSSSEDPNPLKYLRQQSLPSSKYTATVEATIASNMDTFVKATPDRTSPNKGLSKAVPMLTPKPYSLPKNTQQVLKTFKVDGKISMNGEACNGIEEQKESMRFSQPLSRSQRFEGVARVDAAIEEMKFNSATCVDLNSSRPSLQNSFSDLKSFSKEANHTAQREEINCTGKTERFHSEQELKKVNKQPHDATKGGATVTSLEFTPSAPMKDPAVNGKEFEERQKVDAQALIMHWTLEQKEGALPQFSGVPEDAQKLPQRNQLESTKSVQLNITLKIRNAWQRSQFFLESVEAACSEDLPAPATSVNSSSRFCSWDPEEERKRQERWQQEQERLLQERYQKEQEKLKEEWEKAQKEVEEEERKYYEEERKIIEDTVMPLTVSPTSCVLLYDSERIGNSHSVTKEHEQSAQEDNRGTEQSALWAQEGAHCVSEEQLKGKLNVSTVEVDSVMRVKESEPANVSSMKEYSTPNRLTLQLAGQQVASAEAPLPGDIGNTVQRNISPVATRGTDSQENICGSGYSSQPSSSQCPSPNRSVSGKKLCSTCGLPLGKGAAMIIETLSLYFHIQCFKCGICKGQLGDATTGTDVRIRNGLLNCNDCYMKSRTAGHPTPL